MRRVRTPAIGILLTLGATPLASSAQAPAWSLREELRIGRGAFIDELPEITSFMTGPDGRAYALSRSVEILIFDRTGRLLRRVPTVGPDEATRDLPQRGREVIETGAGESSREGQGNGASRPGRTRFRTSYDPLAMGWVGDTLWISRFGVTHLGLFDRDGDSIGSLPFAMDIDGEVGNAPRALLPDRSLLWSITEARGEHWPPAEPIPPPSERYQMPVIPAPQATPTVPGLEPMPVIPGPPFPRDDPPARRFLLRATPGGKVLQGLEIFTPSRKSAVVTNPYGVTARIPIPFQDDPLIAVTPDGSEIVFVERYHAQRPERASYVVARFDGRTGKRTARAYPYAPSPVTAATGDSIVRGLLDSIASPISRRFLEGFSSRAAARAAVLRPLDVTKYLAPITDVVAGADRTVWLREQGTGAWLVIGRDGDVLGRVTLPAGARLLQGDRDSAWALLGDGPAKTASRTLVRYRLVKR